MMFDQFYVLLIVFLFQNAFLLNYIFDFALLTQISNILLFFIFLTACEVKKENVEL